jgi:hypothetical protein
MRVQTSEEFYSCPNDADTVTIGWWDKSVGTYIEWHNCCYVGNLAQLSLLGIGGYYPARRVPSTEPRQATRRGFAFSRVWNERGSGSYVRHVGHYAKNTRLISPTINHP